MFSTTTFNRGLKIYRREGLLILISTKSLFDSSDAEITSLLKAEDAHGSHHASCVSWQLIRFLCNSSQLCAADQSPTKKMPKTDGPPSTSSRSLLVPLGNPPPRVTNSEIQTSSSSMLCILCILPECGVFCIFYVGLPNSKASRGLASVKPDPPHPQTSRHLQSNQQRTNWTILPWHAFLKSCLTCIVDSSRHDVCKDLGAHNTFSLLHNSHFEIFFGQSILPSLFTLLQCASSFSSSILWFIPFHFHFLNIKPSTRGVYNIQQGTIL